MKFNDLKEIAGNTDIYLLDQILKSRYNSSETILDAGCGNGRNIHWFYYNDFTLHGIDRDAEQIKKLKNKYSNLAENFRVSKLEELPFEKETFHHIICNAVLHFAENTPHFETMFRELSRVLKPEGSLFIRMASTMGIEDKIIPISEGVYRLPDGTKRFLITKALLKKMMKQYTMAFLEPLKTVNVNDKRCMSTIVIQKK